MILSASLCQPCFQAAGHTGAEACFELPQPDASSATAAPTRARRLTRPRLQPVDGDPRAPAVPVRTRVENAQRVCLQMFVEARLTPVAIVRGQHLVRDRAVDDDGGSAVLTQVLEEGVHVELAGRPGKLQKTDPEAARVRQTRIEDELSPP